MRFGKRVMAGILAGLMLLSAVGCKKKGKHHGGASSLEELVTKIVTTINDEDGKYSDIAKWYNRYAILPAQVPELLLHDCSFSQLQDVVEDAENGSGYITKHHKDFCRAWEETTGEPISEEIISRLAKLKKQADEKTDADFEEDLSVWRKCAPYDSEFSEDLVEETKNGKDIYGTYTAYGATGWDFLVIFYYVDDGNYVCYNITLLCGDAPEEMRTANENENGQVESAETTAEAASEVENASEPEVTSEAGTSSETEPADTTSETEAKQFDFVTVLEDDMCRWEYGGVDVFKPSANGAPGQPLSVLVMSCTNLSDQPLQVEPGYFEDPSIPYDNYYGSVKDEPIMVMTVSTSEDAELKVMDEPLYRWVDEWDPENDAVAPGETIILYVYVSTSRIRGLQKDELLQDVTVNFSAFPKGEKESFRNYLIAMDGSGEVVLPEKA